jgi:branched-chain amino acid transport system permease protein
MTSIFGVTQVFGVPLQALFGQLVLGLVNGCFYAMLSLGLAIIFGLLDIINFAHGTFYMVGAVAAWFLLAHFQIGFWWSLLLAPLVVALWASPSNAACYAGCTRSKTFMACC